MNISLKNTCLNRSGNLFVWTGKTYNPGWNGNMGNPIEIVPWTWQRWAGALGGSEAELCIQNITDHSVEVREASSYKGCVFVDLPADDYILKFNIDKDFYMNEYTYIRCENDKWKYISGTNVINVTKGVNIYKFSIKDGFYTKFGFGKPNAGWAKLTDIKIQRL